MGVIAWVKVGVWAEQPCLIDCVCVCVCVATWECVGDITG